MSTAWSRNYDFTTDYLNGTAIDDRKVEVELDDILGKLNEKVIVQAAAPSSPIDGETWVNTGVDPIEVKVYDNTNSVWILIGYVRPDNLLKNGSFEFKASATATDPPEGWAKVGTPSDITVAATDASEEGANHVKITADAATEGISQTLSTLKASTNYLVVARAKVTSGDTAKMDTTGGGTNLAAQSTTNTSYTTLQGVFKTDATPTAVVLRLYANANTDVVYFDSVAVYEITSEHVFTPHPNDAHLQATHYQNNAGTDATYGLFRMEHGISTLAAGTKAITFENAFKTTPIVLLQDTTGANAMYPSSITTSGFTANGTSTDTFAWVAIGVAQ